MSIVEPRLPLLAPTPGIARLRDRLAPTAAVALALALVLGAVLVHDHGDLAGPVCFGAHFAAFTHPPQGVATCGRLGYDGQFFDLLAHDPLLVHGSTLEAMRGAGELFRVQRLGYPLLAFLVSGGQAGAIPAALLAVNVLVLLALTSWLAGWLARHDRSPWWAAVVALMPGMLLPVLRDLSDPLATACVIVGVLAWQERRRHLAAVALTAALLTREASVVIILALAAEVAVRAWPARRRPGAARAIVREAAPVLALPMLGFAAWQVYVTVRCGGALGTSAAAVPLLNLVQEVRGSLRDWPPGVGVWDMLYVTLVFAAVAAALVAWRRGATVIAAAACAAILTIVVPRLGDFWSDTRLSAPLFALVLLDGLQRRDRWNVRLGTAAAVMTLLILPAVV